MRALNLAVAIAVLCSCRGASQDKVPDFSGIWRWNPQKSHHSGQAPEDMRVKIEQNGSDITTTLRVRSKGNEEMNTAHYRIGSADNHNEIHGAPMNSSAKWQGAVLVIDSVASFDGRELRMNDRWTLSGDGGTLTFQERHQFGDEPAGEETMVFEKQANGTWEPPQPPKMAEEVYKNIQIMKGMPSPRLMPVMMMFTRALGVQCDHCHVPNEFEKDDKTAKQTARHMLQMVRQINDDNFAGNRQVSCWTCHRGSVKPESAPK